MTLNEYGKRHIPLKFTWEMTEKCNLNCLMCYSIDCNSTQKNNSELSTQEAIKLLDILEKNQVLYLLLDGGEPLLRSDFFQILELATTKFCTWLSTNGTLITSKEAKLFKDYKIGTVFVSLHGHNAGVHESITRSNNSFNETVRGIEELIRHKVPVMTTIQVSKLNNDYIEEYIKLCKELQIPKINFLRPYPLGNEQKNFHNYSLNASEYKEITDMIDEKSSENNIEIGHSFGTRNHNCCKQAFSADSNGYLMNCPYLRFLPRLGHVFDNDLLSIWNSQDSNNIRNSYLKIATECFNCKNSNFCNAGCVAGRLLEDNNFTNKDPICWLRGE